MSTHYIATRDFDLDMPSGEDGRLIVYGGCRGDLVLVPDEVLGVDGNAQYLAARGLRPLNGGTAEELIRERNAARTATNPRAVLSALVREGVATRIVRGDPQ